MAVIEGGAGRGREELRRLAVLRGTALLDTPTDRHFDRLTARAAAVCDVPIALLSLVDVDRQWFKSRVGIDVEETPRSWSFCEHTFAGAAPMVVPDARADERFSGNPLVTRMGVRLYAGVPLRVEGQPLGALCVIDMSPRTLSPEQLGELADLAEQAELLLELSFRRTRGVLHLAAARHAESRVVEKRRQLEESEERYRRLAERSPDGILLSTGGRISYANPTATALFAPGDGGLLGRDVLDFIHPDDHARAEKAARATEQRGDDAGPSPYRVRTGDGRVVEVEARSVAGVVEGRPGTQTVIRDVSARVREQRTREGLREVFERIASGAPLPDTLARLANIAEDRVPGLRCSIVLLESAATRGGEGGPPPVASAAIRLHDGTVAARFDVDASAVSANDLDGGVLDELREIAAVAIEHSVTRDAVEHGAAYDELTGLLNRRTLVRALSGLLDPADPDTAVAVLFVDIDDFNVVNDSLGHEAGDEVLRSIAVLLGSVLDHDDVLARFSGDKFVICRGGISRPDDVQALVARLRGALSAPLRLAGSELRVQATFGIAVSTGAGDAQRLIADADAALVRAKHHGGGGGADVWYDEELRTRASRRLELEAALRHAIDTGELDVFYQPKVRLSDGLVVGAEALVRWPRPGLEPVHPSEFVPLAEATDLIHALGRLVLREACREAARWRAERPGLRPTVAVNVSAEQLCDPGFVDAVAAVIAEAGLPPAALCLELTETSIMRDPRAATEVLRGLKALGTTLAIDDFGTGYSSLSYLKDLPIDQLKIDRSFVGDLGHAPVDRHIVAAIVAIAAALGLDVVAEGVETPAQLRALVDLGCTTAQGFLWSPAVPSHELDRFLDGPVELPVTEEPEVALRGRAGVDDLDDALALIHHELRSPLAVLVSYGELLASGAVEGTDAGTVLERNARRAASMLDQLKGVREVSTGTVALRREPTDLGELVARVVAEVVGGGDGAEVELAVPSSPLVVDVDPSRIDLVLLNLLGNAVRFSPPDAPVSVDVQAQPGIVQITVADRGPGVPDEQTGIIFRKFGLAHRGQGSRTGLGLYLARGLARAHGGEVHHAHRSGGGAVFTLRLPSSRTRP